MHLDASGKRKRTGQLNKQKWSLELVLYKEDLAAKPFKSQHIKDLLKLAKNGVVQTYAGSAHGWNDLQQIINETIRDLKDMDKAKKKYAKKLKQEKEKKTSKKTSKTKSKRIVIKKSSTKKGATRWKRKFKK